MWVYECINSGDDYMAHHGILGMKWGVRRYQNYDGSYTKAGMERYLSAQKNYQTMDRLYKKNKRRKLVRLVGKEKLESSKMARKKAKEELSKEYDNLKNQYAEDKRSEKAERKKLYLNADGSKKNILQRHKIDLIEDYKHRGYSQVAAETAAKQRMKAEAAVAVVATVTAAVVIKKVGTRIGQDYCDSIIKSGKTIQNINAKRDETFSDRPFYAALNRSDKKLYGHLFPREKIELALQAERSQGVPYEGVYRNKLVTTKNIKRASVANARKILNEKLLSDPEYKKRVISAIEETQYGAGAKSLLRSNPKKFYDRFNQALATPAFQKAGIDKEFYAALEKKGYNAILDINDTRYSGYKKWATSPTIVFGKEVVKKMESQKIREEAANLNANAYINSWLKKSLAKEVATLVGVGTMAKNVKDARKVEAYLEDHPNSELSKKEILKMLKRY